MQNPGAQCSERVQADSSTSLQYSGSSLEEVRTLFAETAQHLADAELACLQGGWVGGEAHLSLKEASAHEAAPSFVVTAPANSFDGHGYLNYYTGRPVATSSTPALAGVMQGDARGEKTQRERPPSGTGISKEELSPSISQKMALIQGEAMELEEMTHLPNQMEQQQQQQRLEDEEEEEAKRHLASSASGTHDQAPRDHIRSEPQSFKPGQRSREHSKDGDTFAIAAGQATRRDARHLYLGRQALEALLLESDADRKALQSRVNTLTQQLEALSAYRDSMFSKQQVPVPKVVYRDRQVLIRESPPGETAMSEVQATLAAYMHGRELTFAPDSWNVDSTPRNRYLTHR